MYEKLFPLLDKHQPAPRNTKISSFEITSERILDIIVLPDCAGNIRGASLDAINRIATDESVLNHFKKYLVSSNLEMSEWSRWVNIDIVVCARNDIELAALTMKTFGMVKSLTYDPHMRTLDYDIIQLELKSNSTLTTVSAANYSAKQSVDYRYKELNELKSENNDLLVKINDITKAHSIETLGLRTKLSSLETTNSILSNQIFRSQLNQPSFLETQAQLNALTRENEQLKAENLSINLRNARHVEFVTSELHDQMETIRTRNSDASLDQHIFVPPNTDQSYNELNDIIEDPILTQNSSVNFKNIKNRNLMSFVEISRKSYCPPPSDTIFREIILSDSDETPLFSAEIVEGKHWDITVDTLATQQSNVREAQIDFSTPRLNTVVSKK